MNQFTFSRIILFVFFVSSHSLFSDANAFTTAATGIHIPEESAGNEPTHEDAFDWIMENYFRLERNAQSQLLRQHQSKSLFDLMLHVRARPNDQLQLRQRIENSLADRSNPKPNQIPSQSNPQRPPLGVSPSEKPSPMKNRPSPIANRAVSTDSISPSSHLQPPEPAELPSIANRADSTDSASPPRHLRPPELAELPSIANRAIQNSLSPKGLHCSEIPNGKTALDVLPTEMTIECGQGNVRFHIKRRGSVLMIFRQSQNDQLPQLLSIVDAAAPRESGVANALRAIANMDRADLPANQNRPDWDGLEGLNPAHNSTSPFTGSGLGRTLYRPDAAMKTLFPKRVANEVTRRLAATTIPFLGFTVSKLLNAIDQGDQASIGRFMEQMIVMIESGEMNELIDAVGSSPEQQEALQQQFKLILEDMGVSATRWPLGKVFSQFFRKFDLENFKQRRDELAQQLKANGCQKPVLAWLGRDGLTLLGSLLGQNGGFLLDGYILTDISVQAGSLAERAMVNGDKDAYQCAAGQISGRALALENYDRAMDNVRESVNVLRSITCPAHERESKALTPSQKQTVQSVLHQNQRASDYLAGNFWEEGINENLRDTDLHQDPTEKLRNLSSAQKDLGQMAERVERAHQIAITEGKKDPMSASFHRALQQWAQLHALWLEKNTIIQQRIDQLRAEGHEEYKGFAGGWKSHWNKRINRYRATQENNSLQNIQGHNAFSQAYQRLNNQALAQGSGFAETLNAIIHGEVGGEEALNILGGLSTRSASPSPGHFSYLPFERKGTRLVSVK